jgi:drug/metabolite transporter (DMT)-like permease
MISDTAQERGVARLPWRSHPAWAYALVVLATLFWAGNVTLGRALRFSAGPFTITAGRMVIASLVFLILMRSLPPGERGLGRAAGRSREWLALGAMALLGMVGCPVTLYIALRYTTATTTSLISGSGPLITLMLTAALLGTRLTRSQVAGAGLSLLGVALLIAAGEGWELSGFRLNLGAVIMLGNMVMWGLYSVISRVVTRQRSALWSTAYSTWLATPVLVALAALIEWRQAPPVIDAALVLAVLYIAIFATCLAYMMWNEGVRRVGPEGAMAFYNMLPVFGVLLAAIFLGEQGVAGQWLGGSLIIAGALVAALWGRRSESGYEVTKVT